MFGWHPSEVVGTPLRLAVPEERDAVATKVRTLVSEGNATTRVRFRAGRRDGALVWVDCWSTVVRTDDGSVDHVVSSMRDVTEQVQHELALADREAALRATLDSLLDPHVRLEAVRDVTGRVSDFRIDDVNPAACGYLETERSALLGAPLLALFPAQHESGLFDRYVAVVETGEPLVLDGFRFTSDVAGVVRHFDFRGVKVGDGLSLTWRDTTARNEVAEALRQQERTLRMAMDCSPVGMALVDLDRTFTAVNPALCRLLGCDAAWLLGRRVPDVLHPLDDELDLQMRAEAIAETTSPQKAEKRLIRPDGGEVWVEHSIGVLRDDDGAALSFVSQFIDVAEAHRSREQLSFEATHDSLTHLLNRRALHSRMRCLLAAEQIPHTGLAVLYVDVDNLKPVNDEHGHAAGDSLLVEVARRVTSHVRANDVVARVGGDEFVALLETVRSPHDAVAVAEKLRESFAQPLVVGGRLLRVSVSIGVAFAVPDDDPDTVLARADAALYRAKRSGGGSVVLVEA